MPSTESTPPRNTKGNRVTINGDHYFIEDDQVTARQLLNLAGLEPPDRYCMRLKAPGERPRKLELDESVDLSHPGIEKFKALPRDQTEG